MNRLPVARKVPRWESRLFPLWVRLTRRLRRRRLRSEQKLVSADLRGVERLRDLVNQNAGVLLTPNHAAHPDPFLLCDVADAVGRPFHYMTAWQVFASQGHLARRAMQWYGCFSVDREGTDLAALKQAIGILSKSPNPLVIFPEGEVYHTNDRVTPFRDGPAVIALTAQKHADRPIYVVPCATKYRYVTDPTPELEAVMTELEQHVYWRPQTKRPLVERVYQFAQGVLALKEIEYLGSTQSGTLSERLNRLSEHILGGLERTYNLNPRGQTIPERVKSVRRACLERLEPADAAAKAEVMEHLDDVFLVVQLFSYPGDYIADQPTIERLAETVDKLEEDGLGYHMARGRGERSAIFQIGEPIELRKFAAGAAQPRKAAGPLTDALEQAVQGMLDEINRSDPSSGARP
jgi:1-acyl-sn-glycerol-3-phosphate acyltransferase